MSQYPAAASTKPPAVTHRSPIRGARKPPSTAPIGSAIRNRPSTRASWVVSAESRVLATSTTSTSVTMSAAPATMLAKMVAR